MRNGRLPDSGMNEHSFRREKKAIEDKEGLGAGLGWAIRS